jgi:DmsE family decaheme c-type cytochrome
MRTRTAVITITIAMLAIIAAAQPSNPAWPTSAVGTEAKSVNTSAEQLSRADGYAGTEACLACHDDQSRRFKNTPMGRVFAHPRTADEKHGCESCHGPGQAHVDAGGGKDTIRVRFGKESGSSIEEQNAACVVCHSRGNQLFWRGSEHESRGMACVNCHQIKPVKHDALTSEARFNSPVGGTKSLSKSEPEVCLQCHQMKKAQLQRSSHMPYREGKVTCSSCHNPHGSANPRQLLQATANENCYSCHGERRGPFAWEHPAVLENCLNCHDAHGSSNPQLLKTRQPRLCNECHVTNRHPTQPQNLNVKVFNRGCTNCHSTLHGSNHPSGNMFLR